MMKLRKAEERGHFDHGWLKTYHTFSFDAYHDPAYMGFRSLRVINEDWVQAGEGFPTHGHRDMEIVTYVLEGALQHRDSMGNGSIIRPGDVQRMSAGSGITHSEFNASKSEMVHLLQIWVLPERRGINPGYEQKHFSRENLRGKMRLIASRDGREGSVTIHQDAEIFASTLSNGESIHVSISEGRAAWLQLAQGAVQVNGIPIEAGDGAAITAERELQIKSIGESEFLLFDLS